MDCEELSYMIKGLVIATQKGELTEITQAVADMVDLAVAISYDQGVKLATQGEYDVIILGVVASNHDNASFLGHIRNRHVDAPVLMISQPDEIMANMPGYEVGTDDILRRPYTEVELRLRLQGLIKHVHQMQSNRVMTYRQMEVNLSNRKVSVAGEVVHLAGKEFDILVYFLSHRNRIIAKSELFDEIWGDQSVTSITVVEVYLSMLRKKLRQVGYADCIRTLRNVGYILDDH